MNTITKLQEQIDELQEQTDALQEQLLLLTKETVVKVASKKSLLSKDCVISHYFVTNGLDGFSPDVCVSWRPDDPTVFLEPYAEDYAKAFNTFFALRHCEGSETPVQGEVQYTLSSGFGRGVRGYQINPLRLKWMVDKINCMNVIFDTEENANKAIETVGEENILHMMKTFAGVF